MAKTLTDSSTFKKTIALLEVLAVLSAVVALFRFRSIAPKSLLIWEETLFGFPAVGKYFIFFIFPTIIILLRRNKFQQFGIQITNFTFSGKLVMQAFSVIGPACMGFWVVSLFGWSVKEWKGALSLTVIFAIASFVALIVIKPLKHPKKQYQIRQSALIFYLAPLLLMLVSAMSFPKVSIVSGIIHYFVFVGFGEELLFRGYVQSRLNQVFAKKFSLFGIQFGWGLIIAAVFFGLIHAFNTNEPSWAWALFPIPLGILFGFIREKEGSIVACAMLHGLVDLPLAFVG